MCQVEDNLNRLEGSLEDGRIGRVKSKPGLDHFPSLLEVYQAILRTNSSGARTPGGLSKLFRWRCGTAVTVTSISVWDITQDISSNASRLITLQNTLATEITARLIGTTTASGTSNGNASPWSALATNSQYEEVFWAPPSWHHTIYLLHRTRGPSGDAITPDRHLSFLKLVGELVGDRASARPEGIRAYRKL
ncbi:hypothetical protein BGZ63DRAFT_403552 [Mariannaea sp. PMI_226]|nr:hypothetical protein BGZ63DRAFT_403552 [Mariannaea sp. PMI_226]